MRKSKGLASPLTPPRFIAHERRAHGGFCVPEELPELPVVDPEAADFDNNEEDVDLVPSEVADSPAVVAKHLPADILKRYEVYSYRSAALILKEAHPDEFAELMDVLRTFSITTRMIRMPGGNESEIPKAVSSLLRPKGWHETVIQADLLVRLLWREPTGEERNGRDIFQEREEHLTRAKFLDGHKVDYVKNRVAFDLEWNSKDQTFDRDLYAFSAFSQCGVVDVGVLVTRSMALNPVFRSLGPALDKDGRETSRLTHQKYGASTTWMGKLLYRLNAGRNGSCPVLAFGIRPPVIEDWTPPDAT